MNKWLKSDDQYAVTKANIEPGGLYTRTSATRELGINNDRFCRDFKDNSLYLAFGEEPIPAGRASLYKGSELLAQIERLSDPLNGVELYRDYRLYLERAEKGEEEEKKARDDWDAKGYRKSPQDVFASGTYLGVYIGWME